MVKRAGDEASRYTLPAKPVTRTAPHSPVAAVPALETPAPPADEMNQAPLGDGHHPQQLPQAPTGLRLKPWERFVGEIPKVDGQTHRNDAGEWLDRLADPHALSRDVVSHLGATPHESNFQLLKDVVGDSMIIPGLTLRMTDVDADIAHLEQMFTWWYAQEGTKDRPLSIGEIEFVERGYQDVPAYRKLFAAVDRLAKEHGQKAVIDLHLGPISSGGVNWVLPGQSDQERYVAESGVLHTPSALAPLYAEFPDVSFVLSHPYNQVGTSAIDAMFANPNVYVGTAANESERVELLELLNSKPEYAPFWDRVVYQTDSDPSSLHWWADRLWDPQQPQRLGNLLYGNNARILGLQAMPESRVTDSE